MGEFTFSGRLGPLVAFVAVVAFMYFTAGYSNALELVIQLCAAYAVAFLVLAGLGMIVGPNPSWSIVLATAAIGAVAGGFAAATVALAPDWRALVNWQSIRQDWMIGSAFSAFFVGLSLAAAALRQREQSEFETRQRLLEAKLNMLAARIEPHFLMNTLANLRYLVRSDSVTAYRMLDHLSDFLQGALERSRDLGSTLGHEVQLIESYLSIMQIRLGSKLEFSIELPDSLRSTPFPALLLQTLVENAVTHGIEPADWPGRVTVCVNEDADGIGIAVTDNGKGFDPSGKVPEGLGLQNVRERLAVLYGGDAVLDIVSLPASGTAATLRIPRTAGFAPTIN